MEFAFEWEVKFRKENQISIWPKGHAGTLERLSFTVLVRRAFAKLTKLRKLQQV